MKKVLKATLAVVIVVSLALAMASCTGGGGGSKKSGLKPNEVLGSIPVLYADYYLASNALKEKYNKDTDGLTNAKKHQKLTAEYEKKDTELDAKFEADCKAEWAKLEGKDIPFSLSDGFQRLGIGVKSLKLSEGGIAVSFVAAQELRVNLNNADRYGYVSYKALAKDGSVINSGRIFVFTGLSVRNGKVFAPGDSLKEDGSEVKVGFNFGEEWADFASFEFISPDE